MWADGSPSPICFAPTEAEVFQLGLGQGRSRGAAEEQSMIWPCHNGRDDQVDTPKVAFLRPNCQMHYHTWVLYHPMDLAPSSRDCAFRRRGSKMHHFLLTPWTLAHKTHARFRLMPVYAASATLGQAHALRPFVAPQPHMPRKKLRHVVISLCLSLALVVLPTAYSAPKWWEKGWPRKRVGSVAEAELLSQLAAILMPNSEIRELFRSFPSPEGWGGHALEPDLAAHGILKEKDAALFVEYDGFWRHQEKRGITNDKKKNAALLGYAPEGSYVVRISHTKRKPLQGNVLWIKVNTWRQGHLGSLLDTLKDAVTQISTGLVDALCKSYLKRFHGQTDISTLAESGRQFAESAAIQMGGNTSEEVTSFLGAQGFSAQNIKMLNMETCFCVQDIEICVKPKFKWLEELGLTRSQVAKAVAARPQILRLSIEQNLNPTVQWFLDLGLTKSQIAKAVAIHPQILGYSIKQNLQPTVQWFLDLGLRKSQVAKAVAAYPQMLGLSIERNLKPTVQWFFGLGLTKSQVAKAVTGSPQIIGYSIGFFRDIAGWKELKLL